MSRNRGLTLLILLTLTLPARAIATKGPTMGAQQPQATTGTTSTSSAAVLPATQTLTANAPRDIVKGQLTIVAPGRRWAALTLTAQPLLLSNYAATLRFSKLAGASRVQLNDPRLGCQVDVPCTVDFEIIDAKARGNYVGKVDLDAGSEHLTSAAVNLMVTDTGQTPVVASDFLKGNTFEFDATKEDSFFLSLSNPAGSPSRSLKLVALPGTIVAAKSIFDRRHPASPCPSKDDGVAAQFYPPSLLLDVGANAEIRVAAPQCLKVGTYKSVLQIIDADDGLVVTSKELKISKAASEASRRWALLCWVVLGAALSVALNNAFPLRRARADRFDELSKVKTKLNGCGSIGPALRGALRSEAQRLWLLIDSVTFINTQKDAILTEAAQGVQALSQLVGVADCINSLRAECTGVALPIRTLLVIEVSLRDAELALMRSDVAGAQARVTAATQLARTDCDAKALAGALATDIDKLLAERHNGDDGVPAAGRSLDLCHASREEAIKQGRPRSIAQRIVLMELNRATVGTQPLPDLLSLERDFYIAEVWTNIIEITVANFSDGAKERLTQMLEPLLTHLEIAPAAEHTQLALALMKSNLSFAHLEDALEQQQAKIACSPYARYLDLETYQFQFLNPVLCAVPAATQLLGYQWQFDDLTTPPDDGDRCKHFFWPPGRWRRMWHWVGLSAPPIHKVTVSVSASFLRVAKTYEFTQVIAMQRQRDRESSLGAIQYITFGITTGMAVLAAFGAQYGGVLPISIDWGAGVTALLFGFGIDQIRDRAASK